MAQLIRFVLAEADQAIIATSQVTLLVFPSCVEIIGSGGGDRNNTEGQIYRVTDNEEWSLRVGVCPRRDKTAQTSHADNHSRRNCSHGRDRRIVARPLPSSPCVSVLVNAVCLWGYRRGTCEEQEKEMRFTHR